MTQLLSDNKVSDMVIVKLGPRGQQIFTSSGTFIAPTGVTTVSVLVVAGGGGGGAGGPNYRGGGGGGAGGLIFEESYSVTPFEEINVTIGAGGDGGDTARL